MAVGGVSIQRGEGNSSVRCFIATHLYNYDYIV